MRRSCAASRWSPASPRRSLLALLALIAGGLLWPVLLLTLATSLAVLGLLVERWLMFAEATHTVTLYYTGR